MFPLHGLFSTLVRARPVCGLVRHSGGDCHWQFEARKAQRHFGISRSAIPWVAQEHPTQLHTLRSGWCATSCEPKREWSLRCSPNTLTIRKQIHAQDTLNFFLSGFPSKARIRKIFRHHSMWTSQGNPVWVLRTNFIAFSNTGAQSFQGPRPAGRGLAVLHKDFHVSHRR